MRKQAINVFTNKLEIAISQILEPHDLKVLMWRATSRKQKAITIGHTVIPTIIIILFAGQFETTNNFSITILNFLLLSVSIRGLALCRQIDKNEKKYGHWKLDFFTKKTWKLHLKWNFYLMS